MSILNFSLERNGVVPSLLAAFALAGPLLGDEPIGLIGEVRGGYLIGGSRGGFWMKSDLAKECVSSAIEFRTFALDGAIPRAAVRAKVIPGSEPCPETIRLDFASDDARSEPVLAVACSWNPAPRKIRICDIDNQTYRDAATAVLKAAGLAGSRIRVDQLLRVDLDGDGEEEAIVASNTFAPGRPEPNPAGIGRLPPRAPDGFHSLVFVRRLVGEQVQTTVLIQEIARPKRGLDPMPVTNRVAAVLDLNGDGRLEIVTHGRYYEGEWFDVFDIEGLAARKVLTAGCGA
jgi:hypothetical protein